MKSEHGIRANRLKVSGSAKAVREIIESTTIGYSARYNGVFRRGASSS